jgi:2-polyprenyl-3-methyl-5-hydroxy-6-metoxy-1,4-benzoquinol methylase
MVIDNTSNYPDGLINVPCPRCASEVFETVYQGVDYLYKIPGQFFVAQCTFCGLVYQNPCPLPEHISRYYPSDYLPHKKNATTDSNQEKEKKIWWGRRYLSDLFGITYHWLLNSWQMGCNLSPNFIEGAMLLEIGCATGSRLAALRDLGWKNLQGVELVEQAAELARNQGFDVITGPIENHLSSLPDASLDVVVSSMVLEHLYNPFEIVRLIADKLKPGGQFLFSTIVRDSLDAAIYGKYFAGFDIPRHLVHFKKMDVEKMVGPYFEVVECFHHNAPIDYVRSSSWRIEYGNGSVFDKAIVTFGNSMLASFIGLILAQLRLTCRVSFRCTKKQEHSR